jgi:hypothetical protein
LSVAAIIANGPGWAAPFPWTAHGARRWQRYARNTATFSAVIAVRDFGHVVHDRAARHGQQRPRRSRRIYPGGAFLQLPGPAVDQAAGAALRVPVHVHRERTRYGTRNRPPRDRLTGRDGRGKPARRYTLGEGVEAAKVLRDDVYIQDASGGQRLSLPRRALMYSTSSVICGRACSTAGNRPTGNLRYSPPCIRTPSEFARTWCSSATKRQVMQRYIRRDRLIAACGTSLQRTSTWSPQCEPMRWRAACCLASSRCGSSSDAHHAFPPGF